MGFYSSDMDACYVESATLLEEIVLPSLPPFPTFDEIEAGTVYFPSPLELYEDTVGMFSIPIMTPLSDTSEITETTVSTTKRNISNSDCNLEVSSYTSTNYIPLTIPKYILLNFLDVVPKGTKFIVAFIGGSTSIEDIKVIGVQ